MGMDARKSGRGKGWEGGERVRGMGRDGEEREWEEEERGGESLPMTL